MKKRLLGQLKHYEWMWTVSGWSICTDSEIEKQQAERFRALLTDSENPFVRASTQGHVTASAVITCENHSKILLTHHKKLGMWIQLGGHIDDGEWVFDAALREAREESGLTDLKSVQWAVTGEDIPWDIDVHPIPENPKEAAHYHFDVRYLFTTQSPDKIAISSESRDLKWFDVETLLKTPLSESMKRQIAKLEGLRRDGIN